MNAIELLKKDHEVVADLFEQVRSTPGSKHRPLFKKIKAELDVHTHIEETVLYPRLKKDGNKKLTDITSEGIEEHHQVKMFLKELDELRGKKDVFEAKLKVLIEDVEHHVKEEEDTMFPLIEDQFSESALEKLGTSLENKKKKFIASNPTAARNLVRRTASQKKGMIGAIYEKAVTAVGEILIGTGDKGPSVRPSAKKAGNGNKSASPKATGNGNGRSANKSRARSSAPAMRSKTGAAGSQRASGAKSRPSGGRKGATAK